MGRDSIVGVCSYSKKDSIEVEIYNGRTFFKHNGVYTSVNKNSLKDVIAAFLDSYDRLELEYNGPSTAVPMPGLKYTSQDYLSDVLRNGDICPRTYNILKVAGCDTLGDVAEFEEYELAKLRTLGEKTMAEVKTALALAGLQLK